ncbi:PREDICTED: tropinone reductase homolog At1g07440-like, partial [Tarenaya hassleriana]|uniref:tropinone reductase homolog At1g07440-like n=1 Tax=Tarenaya hassleriana TaxID=28532 RepID=UPI00053C5E84
RSLTWVFFNESFRYAIVEELAGFGARVHTCARNQSLLDQCLREWQTKGFQVTGSVCDVSSRPEREKLMQTVSSAFDGKLNILINNVGTSIVKPTTEYTAEDFSFHITTNLESAYHLSQLAHPLVKATGFGNIVFISSIAGIVSTSVGSIYNATKGAINQLARNLQNVSETNVRASNDFGVVTSSASSRPTATPYNRRPAEQQAAQRILQENQYPRNRKKTFKNPKSELRQQKHKTQEAGFCSFEISYLLKNSGLKTL